MDGKPWKESRGEIEIFVSGVNGLIFEVRNRSGIKKASICMSLDGMKKDPNLVYKLRIQENTSKQISVRSRSQILGLDRFARQAIRRGSRSYSWKEVIIMSKIVLCETKPAKVPYKIAKIGRSFQSYEEFCWLLEHYLIFFLTEGFEYPLKNYLKEKLDIVIKSDDAVQQVKEVINYYNYFTSR